MEPINFNIYCNWGDSGRCGAAEPRALSCKPVWILCHAIGTIPELHVRIERHGLQNEKRNISRKRNAFTLSLLSLIVYSLFYFFFKLVASQFLGNFRTQAQATVFFVYVLACSMGHSDSRSPINIVPLKTMTMTMNELMLQGLLAKPGTALFRPINRKSFWAHTHSHSSKPFFAHPEFLFSSIFLVLLSLHRPTTTANEKKYREKKKYRVMHRSGLKNVQNLLFEYYLYIYYYIFSRTQQGCCIAFPLTIFFCCSCFGRFIYRVSIQFLYAFFCWSFFLAFCIIGTVCCIPLAIVRGNRSNTRDPLLHAWYPCGLHFFGRRNNAHDAMDGISMMSPFSGYQTKHTESNILWTVFVSSFFFRKTNCMLMLVNFGQFFFVVSLANLLVDKNITSSPLFFLLLHIDCILFFLIFGHHNLWHPKISVIDISNTSKWIFGTGVFRRKIETWIGWFFGRACGSHHIFCVGVIFLSASFQNITHYVWEHLWKLPENICN